MNTFLSKDTFISFLFHRIPSIFRFFNIRYDLWLLIYEGCFADTTFVYWLTALDRMFEFEKFQNFSMPHGLSTPFQK